MKTFKELNENMAVAEKYIFTSHAPIHGVSDGDDLKHVVAHKGKLKNLKVPHPHDKDGEYGPSVRIAVKNKETGATSHHLVYQSGYTGTKPIMSIRSHGPGNEHSAEHAAALMRHLSGKSLKEETESVDESLLMGAALVGGLVAGSRINDIIKGKEPKDGDKKLKDKVKSIYDRVKARKQTNEEQVSEVFDNDALKKHLAAAADKINKDFPGGKPTRIPNANGETEYDVEDNPSPRTTKRMPIKTTSVSRYLKR